MGDDMRKVCLSVAVANSVRGKYLSAAINEARHIHDWAKALGYESTLLTDEDGPVTLADLRKAIEAVLWPVRADAQGNPLPAPETARLILYFAGHGLLREAGEGLWLLSDWQADLRAVGVEPLKRRLFRYPVRQVTLIGDACLDLPKDMDQTELVADPVLGNGPTERREPAIDKFTATQDGTTTFMVPGADPDEDRCVFSGVLLEGLWGLNKAAFAKYRPTEVTSQSLSDWLRSEVPKVSKRYDKERNPSASHAFSEGEDVYFSSASGLTPPKLPGWPDPGTVMGMGLGRPVPEPGAAVPREYREVVIERDSEDSTAFLTTVSGPRRMRRTAAIRPRPAPRPKLGTLIDQLGELRPDRFRNRSALGAHGAAIAAIWHSPAIKLERQEVWWLVRPASGGTRLADAAPLLVETADGQVAATIIFPGMETRITYDANGASSLMMGSVQQPTSSGPTRDAIEAMERGALDPGKVRGLATKLRQMKHVDPVLGAISAYLYDAIGDVESIRRMAYFYVEHDQPIPYDIALLGMLRGWRKDGRLMVDIPAVAACDPRDAEEKKYEWTYCATEATSGVVGGDWPWMRQGWAFLDDPTGDEATLIVPELLEALPRLGRGRFTTFDTDGAAILGRAFGLIRRPQ